MKNLKDKLTLKSILKEGAVPLNKESNIYEIGNQKYMVKNGRVVHSYYFNDKCLRRYEDALRLREKK